VTPASRALIQPIEMSPTEHHSLRQVLETGVRFWLPTRSGRFATCSKTARRS